MSDLDQIATCLGAARSAVDDDVRTLYIASARVKLEAARERLAALELGIGAVEEDLVARGRKAAP